MPRKRRRSQQLSVGGQRRRRRRRLVRAREAPRGLEREGSEETKATFTSGAGVAAPIQMLTAICTVDSALRFV